MTDLPPDASSRRRFDWRERYDAARARGVPLDPATEPVTGVRAYPTDYDPDHLVVTTTEELPAIRRALDDAAGDFGWSVRLETIDGVPQRDEEALERARRGRRDLDLPTIYRLVIYRDPKENRDDKPVPPVDAWRLLQRARARRLAGIDPTDLSRVSLDHVLTVDRVGPSTFAGKTNTFSGKTNPFSGKTNTFSGKTNGTESYAESGSGGRQVVSFVGTAPHRSVAVAPGGRRPVVAILDTGCAAHAWLPPGIVTTLPKVGETVIGLSDPATDPEVVGDVSGPYDGSIDASSGHGTFIAGIVRQVCPEADLVAIRVADSQGTVLESDFMLAVRRLVAWMSLPHSRGGRRIDVLNISLGYYHETPEQELFDRTLHDLLVAARRRGCAVVCSAGNDATDRPGFPAALWDWGSDEVVLDEPDDIAPHVSVGALNPNGTLALFSNIGPWVRTYAPGAAVLSCSPPFDGGQQALVRDDRDGYRRETIDPDDYTGGFALWSGTSFAAPYVAGMLAAAVAEPLLAGRLATAAERVSALQDALGEVVETLASTIRR